MGSEGGGPDLRFVHSGHPMPTRSGALVAGILFLCPELAGAGGANGVGRRNDGLPVVAFPSAGIPGVLEIRRQDVGVSALPAAPMFQPGMPASMPAVPTNAAAATGDRGVVPVSWHGSEAREAQPDGGAYVQRPGGESASQGSASDSEGRYEAAARLPRANPFAPWKLAWPDGLPACK